MNIFLISNAYIEKTMICCLDHLLSITVEKVYLLECNHKKSDMFMDFDTKVMLCKDPFNGVISSDIVIVIRDGIIPDANIKKIQKIAKDNNKEFYCLNGELFYEDDIGGQGINQFNDLPRIVLASYGCCKATQYYCTEIILNKLFSRDNLNFIQFFSQKTLKLIKEFEQIELLNKKLFNLSNKPQVSIEAIGNIPLNYSFKNVETMMYFYENRVDYLILSIDQSIKDINEVLNYFMIMYGKKVDLVLVSQFISMKIWSDKIDTVYKYKKVNNRDDIIWINNGNVPATIMESIQKNITLPKSITICR